MREYVKEQNDYALKNGKIVYIEDAPRFSTGYTCPGCHENMRPVRAHIVDRKSYFRHEAKNVGSIRKCTYSSPTHRRLLAMDILARIKKIKVPNLYKYSPDGKSKKLVRESCFVEANSIKADLVFYEDEDGKIQFDKKECIVSDHILYQSDITFFNVLGLPILLIQFVENYKTTDEEKIQLRQLGIDAIKVIIPRDSEESIANSFYTSIICKWIYNGTEQQTPYLQLPSGSTEPVSATDEFESRIFEETFACRSSQINNLIRQISKCLESQQYRTTEQEFRYELSRTGTIAKGDQQRLEQLRKEHRGGAEAKCKDSLESIRTKEREFTELVERSKGNIAEGYRIDEGRLQQYFDGLEERYLSKRRLVEDRRGSVRTETYRINESIGHFEGNGTGQSKFRDAAGRLQNEIDSIERKSESLRAEYNQSERSEQSRYSETCRAIRARINTLSAEFRRKEERIEEDFRKQEEGTRRGIELEEKSTLSEQDRYRRAITDYIEGKDSQGSNVPDGVKKLFEIGRVLIDWKEKYSTYERYKVAVECIRKGDYKKWD